ncbi:MAG: acetyl-CoA carboxylase biotin carboxyl carrier protein [Phycisphaerales bacterium]
MIDIRKLKELVKLMVENDLTEIDLQDQEETVSLRRGTQTAYGAPVVSAPAPSAAPAAPASGTAPSPATSDDDSLHAITSPMVGTYYASPDPESPAYVSAGSSVSDESVVCIVEAMKVFSEIKAECSGTIEKVLVKNGDAVEFGQKLFLVKLG